MLLLKNINKNYKRFMKLLQIIGEERIFNTKLGKRALSSIIIQQTKEIIIRYYDKDGSILFCLKCDKNGTITEISPRKKIDDMAIYCALYEIETIMNSNINKNKQMNICLTSLFRWY